MFMMEYPTNRILATLVTSWVKSWVWHLSRGMVSQHYQLLGEWNNETPYFPRWFTRSMAWEPHHPGIGPSRLSMLSMLCPCPGKSQILRTVRCDSNGWRMWYQIIASSYVIYHCIGQQKMNFQWHDKKCLNILHQKNSSPDFFNIPWNWMLNKGTS